MALSSRVIVVSGDEQVAAALRKIAVDTNGEVMGVAVHAGALVIEKDAKVRAPVLTGNLRRSIHTERGTVTPTTAEATVGTDVEYAPYVEFGTSRMAAQPYLRPAADENEDAIEEAVELVLDAAIRASGLGGLL